MANLLRNVLVSALSVAGLLAQQSPQRDAGHPKVVTPPGYHAGDWVPVAVLWWRDAGSMAAVIEVLTAGGFAVVPLQGAPAPKELGAALTSVRQRVRIAQGGMHAVIATDAPAAIASLLAQRQEFQTVTLCGDAADADQKALLRLPRRRVQLLATKDAAQICDHLLSWHKQRVVAGPAHEVSQVLDSFHDAAAVADEDRYFAILPDDSLFLGTDATERWTGKQFREFAMRYFKLPSAWTYVPMQREVTLSSDGKLAWFDEALDNAGYGECRGTGVLQERDGGWVLLQYNLTVPIPNDLMGGFAKQIRVHLDGAAVTGK